MAAVKNPWRELEADGTDAKADSVERALLDERDLDGIFLKESSVEKTRLIYIGLLEIEVVNLRNLADRQRGKEKGV